jgi:hypothetical protein
MSATSVAEIINQLESLSYFTHVEPADLEQVKTELGTGLVEEHYFPAVRTGRGPGRTQGNGAVLWQIGRLDGGLGSCRRIS